MNAAQDNAASQEVHVLMLNEDGTIDGDYGDEAKIARRLGYPEYACVRLACVLADCEIGYLYPSRVLKGSEQDDAGRRVLVDFCQDVYQIS